MNVDIKFEGIKELIGEMDDLAKKQEPFAVALALNKTADDVKKEIVNKMPSYIDRPTRWTLNSIYVARATKTKPVAEIGHKDKSSIRVTTTNKGQGTPAAYYMEPNVEGGPRNLKGFESSLRWAYVLPKDMYVVPGAACPLDANGNIPHGLIVQILSYFKAAERYLGRTANTTDQGRAKLKKGTRSARGYEYIVSYGKGTFYGRRTINQHLPAGIWKKEVYTHGTRIRPIFIFVKRPSYSKRFPFHEIAQKIINKNFINNFYEAMREALLTSKRPG